MGLLPLEIQNELEQQLRTAVSEFSPIGGGCINRAGKISVSDAHYFIKWNDRLQFPKMLSLEASALQLLRATKTIPTPQVISSGETARFQFLVLEYLEQKPSGRKDYWTVFGTQLACLHQQSSKHFGFNENNYIGSLPQNNAYATRWTDFFVNNRIEFQLKKAIDRGLFAKSIIPKFHQLYRKLPQLLPDEIPALLHGDLWAGNLITDQHGMPCVIDPALYYGHREVDLAMTKLFGGFDEEFLHSYKEQYPLVPGLEKRYELYHLYPLLVHANLFAGNYPAQVVSILNRFV